jgi:TATA-box binding protein (TBP) (component of TFIID and TFIIIB)
MSTVEDYVARIEGTCGAEKDVIVVFKYEKKEEAVARILKKAELKNSLSGIIYELTFQGISFRVYSSGKAIFRSIKNKEELNKILASLLL